MAHTGPRHSNAGEPAEIRGPAPLAIPASVLAGLREAAWKGYPRETCGLLVGTNDIRSVRVQRIHQARNLALARLRDRYTLDPEGFLAADLAARRDGLDIVGIWHTHPDHPARPSVTDRDAAWPGWSYLILSVHPGGVGDIAAWTLESSEFVQQSIEEVPS